MREQRRREAAMQSEPAKDERLKMKDEDNDRQTDSSFISHLSSLPEDRFLQQVEADVPESVRPLLEATRKKKRKRSAVKSDEEVDRIVSDAASSESAYETTTVVRPKIRLDRSALQTFVITREVLGQPRAKHPHRPGLRNR